MQHTATESTVVATKKPDNRWRRGLRHGLRTRRLPFKGGRAIELYRNQFRKAVEDELIQQGREIGPLEASLVCAATLGFEHSLKAGRWLADNHDQLEPEQRLAFSREELHGMREASRMLKELGIARNINGKDLWEYVHEGTPEPLGSEDKGSGVQVAISSPDASTGRVEPVAGFDVDGAKDAEPEAEALP